jgi:uncharacterized protein YjbI with pentapeptide repeats
MGLETINTHTPIAPKRTDQHTAKVDLEIILEEHCEWVKSGGRNGRQADLSRLNFEGADLSDTNLQDAVMNETVLKGADLLLTDLQGASLLQANFENANLLGAKLRDANLQGATLAGATGLQSAELAGTDLTFAKLPAEISPAEELKDVVRMARNASWLIGAMLVLNVLAGGRVLTASDAQILGNAPSLPVPALRNGLPLVQFFLFCPVLIGGLYLWLHVYLQRLWDATAALPAIFQDGRRLDAALPWLVSWPARSYSKWLRERNRGLATVEKTICIVLLYWVAPLTMMLFWARYLTLQDLRGTVLHVLLMAAVASAAIHFPRAAARAFQSDNYQSFSGTFPERGKGSVFESVRQLWSHRGARSESSATDPPRESSFFDPKAIAADAKTTASDAKTSASENKTRGVNRKASSPGMPLALGFGLILCLLSIGTIGGAPHGGNPEQGIGSGSVHTWAADAFWLIGYDPFAQVTEAEISRKPSGWTEEELNRVEGASLNGLRLRHINAYGAFFAKARLRQADLRYAYLSEADLRQANLRQASLRFAVLYQAKLDGAMLQEADLQNANLTRAELVKSDLSFASLAGALLLDAKLDGAVLYSANLRNASLQRASLEQADLREANLEGANLSMADLREAYLSSVKLAGAKLPQGKFNGAILMGADLRRTDLSNSSFQGAVLSGADFTGASLQSADLRGGVGLIASQICAAANVREAQMDDALAGEVGARCGGVH